MKNRMKKTKVIKARDAFDAMNKAMRAMDKAMRMDEPHIQIDLQGGFEKSSESKEFLAAIKNFIQAYKKFYRLEKVEVAFIL